MENEKVDEILENFSESEELLTKFEYNEDKTELVTIVDLVEEEIELIFFTTSDNGFFKYKNGKTNEIVQNNEYATFESFLDGVLSKFCEKRDELIGIGEDTEDENDDDYLSDLSESSEDEDTFNDELGLLEEESSYGVNPLILSVKVAKQIIGEEFFHIIDGIFQLRITTSLEHVDHRVREMCGMGRMEKLVLKIQFTRKFMDNNNQFNKPRIVPKGMKKDHPFQYRMENITNIFLENFWENMEKEKKKSLVEIVKLETIRKKFVKSNIKIESFLQNLRRKEHLTLLKCYLLFSNNLDLKATSKKYLEMTQNNESSSSSTTTTTTTNQNFCVDLNEEEMKVFEEKKSEILFILKLYVYIVLRIETMIPFCMICDEELLEFRSKNQYFIHNNNNNNENNEEEMEKLICKPYLCTKAFCQFEYFDTDREIYKRISYPLLSPITISEEIVHNSVIVDLLLTLCYASCVSERKEIVFNPFPPQFKSNRTLKKKYSAVLECLEKIPSVGTLKSFINLGGGGKNKNNIKNGEGRKYESQYSSTKIMISKDVHLKRKIGEVQFDLLSWLLTTSRGIMVKIPLGKRVLSMHTEFQYQMDYNFLRNFKNNNNNKPPLLLNHDQKKKEEEMEGEDDDDVEREEEEEEDEFEGMKRKYGSFFGFHGSHLCNWHSILKSGLKVGSGTDLETTGSAYGKGIYLTPKSNEAVAYSEIGSGKMWKNSLLSQYSRSLQCLCVCEIVKHPSVQNIPNP